MACSVDSGSAMLAMTSYVSSTILDLSEASPRSWKEARVRVELGSYSTLFEPLFYDCACWLRSCCEGVIGAKRVEVVSVDTLSG